MKKIDLPVALSFFLGKKRAKEIIAKDKEEDTPLVYGKYLRNHLENQVARLKYAELNY